MKARFKKKEEEVYEEVIDIPDCDTTCSICYAEFLDTDDLKQHITHVHLTEHSKKRFCKFCTIIFTNAEDFVLHVRDIHLSYMKYCSYCSRLFTDHAEFKKHEAKHYMFVQNSKYSCSQCKMLFSDISELEQHESNKHPDGPGMVIQEYLPLLSSVLNIKADTFLESLGKPSEYMCIKCEYTTERVQDFICHLKTNGCRSFACSTCSFVYGKKRGLTGHYLTSKSCFPDANKETFKKQCRECQKYFDKKTLKLHRKSCKVIKCVSCDIVFDSITELTKHQSDIHPLAITLVQCTYCRRDFVGNVALNKHIDRAHKSKLHLYKYKCVHCGEIYKHPKKLLGHFYSRHKELEPYTCKICDKKFRIRKNFTLHIKLEHKSIGFVDYDEEYNIFFIDKKPEKHLPEKSDATKEQEVIDAANAETECPSESQTDCPTDTDVEKGSKPAQTPKQRLKDEQKKKSQVNCGKDAVTYNEDENLITKKLETRKRKQRKAESEIDDSEMEVEALHSDSSDEVLVVVKKKARLRKKGKLANAAGNRKSKPEINDARKRFTCTICKKYCFTFQNYHNHISLHYKSESKKCVKCGEEFKSKSQLQEHIITMHSSSKLTETLKNILERKKCGFSNTPKSNSEKFMRTIKKARLDENSSANVTIKPKKDVLSVQNFIENFTPDERKKTDAKPILTMRPVGVTSKEPVIKMTKFIPKPEKQFSGLALPVKFKPCNEKHSVKVDFVIVDEKLNQKTVNTDNENDFMDSNHYESYFAVANDDDNDGGQDTNTIIPDVAQEVQLENNEKPVIPNVAHKIVIPDLPSGYNEICIAHLQPQAPYYKIVKMEELLDNQEAKKEVEEEVDYTLPSGTKLIQANPFAHLLGAKELENMLEARRNKYYKPKKKDFAKAIAKAMLDMDTKKAKPRKKNVMT